MSEPKFQVGDEVILVGKYPDGSSSEYFEDGTFNIGNKYAIADCYPRHIADWSPSGIQYELGHTGTWVDESMLTLASEYYKQQENKVKQSLDNTKIDVAAYAEQYGITLEQAHNEIQPWLFEQGYAWLSEYNYVMVEYAGQLYISDKTILWSNDATYYSAKPNKEIFLERNIVLTIKQEPDTIEIDGKLYDKQSVMNAIKNFEITE